MAIENQRGEPFIFPVPPLLAARVIPLAYVTFLSICAVYVPLRVGIDRFLMGFENHPALWWLAIGLVATIVFFLWLGFQPPSGQPELQFSHDMVRFIPGRGERLFGDQPTDAVITPESREILLCHSFLEEFSDGYRVIVRSRDETEREVRLRYFTSLDAQQWRRLVDGIAGATALPVRLVIRRRLADGSVQETPWTPLTVKANVVNRHLLLAISFALLPYFGGLLVIATRNLGWLALAGALIALVSTSAAYFVRRQRDPATAKQRLILDPMLYGFEFAFSAFVIGYIFLR